MFYSPKKNESNSSLLIELLQRENLKTVNEFKNNCLWLVEENVTPEELANLLGQPTTKIITFFWKKEIFINQNQLLTPDLLQDYCRSVNLKVKSQKTFQFGNIIQTYLEKITPQGSLVERPPVVSIMGHIDHGKTTLLDTINQTNQQKKEVGGITQKVTISATEFKGKRINFLDTPGHSIFIKMRQRGISLTDLVVLVVEAGEGVMFQTAEIINYLQEHKLPVIVFINHKNSAKTDHPTNLHKITAQLSAKGLNPLAIINGNAKKIQDGGINDLLENIIALSDFRSNLQVPANGVIIDSYFDSQTKHWVNELLIQGGELTEKDTLFLNGQFGKVKIGTLYNIFSQKTVTRAIPGDLVRLIDLNIAAELGDRFLVINDKEVMESIQKELKNSSTKKNKLISVPTHQEKKNINLILLTNSENAHQVLHDLVKKKCSPEFNFTIVTEITGNLTNSDLKLVKSTNGTVLLFGKINSTQKRMFQTNNIPFRASEIIYELENELDKIINQQSEKKKVEEEVGVAQVRKVFSFSRGNIAGCRVMKGKIKRNSLIQVWRNQREIFRGEIKSLESEKIKENEISSGQECGIVLKNFNDWQEGDKIIAFQISELDESKP
ncbi:MAG: GTP-binding protein [Candidatus Moeniiplasma glomeromycotorum]|nr:GTP-binding protein [Candidatus Moeniiplasma glomeromycotorum]MCE8162277.1 GTP-binding protein [Candidatus Moeniiplasma glomeromycotorum]MCE8166202.1 GTP-binding protein [Candidatus Moeniiplasma glomeromycotorum]MCE8166683.1 GTP-binding protein [Candidatus Moeniiplasma glomeromycotorum]